MPKHFQLHIQLRHTQVWRRIAVPHGAAFAKLHQCIQAAFNWQGRHLYEFRRGSERLASHPQHESFDAAPVPNAESVKIAESLGRKGAACEYEYDFGDSWVHDIEVEDILLLPANSPWLLDGDLAAPPEDCGGIPGYERLLEICRTGEDPWGDDPAEILEWAGGWSPDSFDRDRLTR